MASLNWPYLLLYTLHVEFLLLAFRNGAEWAEIRQKMQKIFLTPGAAAHFYDDQVKVSEEFADALLRQQKRYGSIRDLRSWSCRYAAECEFYGCLDG